jgi:DNA-directed RNA polymerase subunit H (RpoH/RPB5)
MFAKESRYYNIEDATLVSDRVTITYKKRRFLPDASEISLLQEMTISSGDRLDRIAARLGGDPEQFWRICDTNNVMHPLELTNEPGTIVKIARAWG